EAERPGCELVVAGLREDAGQGLDAKVEHGDELGVATDAARGHSAEHRSSLLASASASTIMWTSASKPTSGRQPSWVLIFVSSPPISTGSSGRTSAGSSTTWRR